MFELELGSMTHEEVPLFDLKAPASVLLEDIPITFEQVQEIQGAFAKAGIAGASEQRRIVQSCTIRRIVKLDDLLSKEVRPILKRIADYQQGRLEPQPQGSAWDNREVDTWIDKL